jgi:hypothetical protein
LKEKNMGATSVTGVGLGAARTQKGPGNGRDYFVPQVNPHVIAAGSVTLSGGTAAVVFPTALADANYVVTLTPGATLANQAYVTSIATTGFTITVSGGGTETVMWVAIKSGFGLDVALTT